MSNLTCGAPVLLYTGTAWTLANRMVRFDAYANRFYFHSIMDVDTAGNTYVDGRAITAIYGISKY